MSNSFLEAGSVSSTSSLGGVHPASFAQFDDVSNKKQVLYEISVPVCNVDSMYAIN